MEQVNNETGAAADVATDAYQSPGRAGGYTRDGQPLAPTVDQSKAAKLESTNMTDEFGRNGVNDAIHSGLSTNSDPSQYTTDADGEARRLGQTLEQQERAEGLNGELDDIHDNNVSRDYTPEGGSVWAGLESNEGREEAHQAEMLEEIGEPLSRLHETVDPQTLISPELLGEVNRYSADLSPRYDNVSTAEISRRISWKLAPMLEMPDNGASVGYRGTDDDGHPIHVLHDAYKPKMYGVDSARNRVRNELLYEHPGHIEGVKASHKSADAVGVITKLFDPKHRDQVQVGRAEDADGNEFGFSVFRDSVTERWTANDWKTPNLIQPVGIGDKIKIVNGKPKPYKNIMSLTVTSKSELLVLERGDGPIITNNHQSENTGQIANPRPMSRHNHVMS